MTFEANGLSTSWRDSRGPVFLKPETLIVPLYHKVRTSVVSLIDRVQAVDAIFETFRAPGLIPLPDRITWDIHLSTLNAFRTELAALPVDDRNKRRLLLRDYPRFLWRIRAAVDGNLVFEALLDATDLLQGQHIVDVVPYDRPACLAIGAATALARASFAGDPQIASFVDWFDNNRSHLQ
jgi:hypothetical protein